MKNSQLDIYIYIYIYYLYLTFNQLIYIYIYILHQLLECFLKIDSSNIFGYFV